MSEIVKYYTLILPNGEHFNNKVWYFKDDLPQLNRNAYICGDYTFIANGHNCQLCKIYKIVEISDDTIWIE